MDIKEQVIKELAYFYLEADSNTTFGERADTINKFADKIVKLFFQRSKRKAYNNI